MGASMESSKKDTNNLLQCRINKKNKRKLKVKSMIAIIMQLKVIIAIPEIKRIKNLEKIDLLIKLYNLTIIVRINLIFL
jgi:hypothetical protein